MPLFKMPGPNKFRLVDVVADTLNKSKSEIRRLIKDGAITVWLSKEKPIGLKYKFSETWIPRDPNIYYDIFEEHYWVVKVGKRIYLTITRISEELLVCHL